ncbi:unnamed protein product [Sphagnum balticum]
MQLGMQFHSIAAEKSANERASERPRAHQRSGAPSHTPSLRKRERGRRRHRSPRAKTRHPSPGRMTGYDRCVWNPASECAPSPGILTGHDRRAWNPASESDSHFVVDYLVARVKTKRDIVGHLHWTEHFCIIHEKAAYNPQSSSLMLHSMDDLRINHPPGGWGRKGAFCERANFMLSLKLTASYQGYQMG